MFYTPDTNNGQSPPAGGVDRPLTSTQILESLFPDIVRTILTMYARAIAFTTEKLPQVLSCEVKVRLVALLLVVSSEGMLDRNLLDLLLRESSLGKSDRTIGLSSSFGTRKGELVNILQEAIPASAENMQPNDSLEILLGISSLLSYLGLGRKQAFFLKDVLSAMIPGLVEARKIGAAEMGIHPSAGLPALQGSSTGGSSPLRHSITSRRMRS